MGLLNQHYDQSDNCVFIVPGLLRDFNVTFGKDISNPTTNAIIYTFTGIIVPSDKFYHRYFLPTYGRVLGIVRNGGDYINQLQIAEVILIGASATGKQMYNSACDW